MKFILFFYSQVRSLLLSLATAFLILFTTNQLNAQSKIVGWGLNTYSQTATLNYPKDSIISVASGYYHTVGLKNDGTVIVWGTNSLTPGPFNNVPALTVPSTLKNVRKIVSGPYHIIALKADSSIVAWGYNNNYQCILPLGLGAVTDVAAGSKHSVALKKNGTVSCWGGSGQTQVPANLTNVTGIAAGGLHSLALKQDGTVVGWGDNTYGQITIPANLTNVIAIAAGQNHSVALKSDGSLVAWGRNDSAQCNIPVGLNNVKSISANGNFSLALKNDSTVVGWGSNNYGQSTIPSGLSGVKSISAGQFHSIVLTRTGLAAWGLSLYGQCSLPVNLDNVKSVSTSEYHSLALKKDGTVVAWGRNDYSQCNVPPGLTGVTAVSAGVYFSAALLSDSTVVIWGYNIGAVPAGLTGVTSISAGGSHVLALTKNGKVTAWGINYFGSCTVPTGLENVRAVAAGSNFSVALKYNGTVVAWGDVTGNQAKIPPGLSGVIAIQAERFHWAALKQDGTVVLNGGGLLPQGTLPGLTHVKAIATSYDHVLGLKEDGTIAIWGEGDEYGVGSPPPGLSRVTAISGGLYSFICLTDTAEQPVKPKASVQGILYRDQNINCLADSSDLKLPGLVVKALPGPYYAMSNNAGKYKLELPVPTQSTNYIIRPYSYHSPIFNIDPVCPVDSQYSVNILPSGDTLAGRDFGYKVTNCHYLEVQLVSNRRRPCFTGRTTISYINKGFLPAADAFILVEFPHWVHPVSASAPHIAVNDSVWKFNLGEVLPAQSGTITIFDAVPCGHPELLGLSQCTKASIYPAPGCSVNPEWSGASLSASGTCLVNGFVRFRISNEGTSNMPDSSIYRIYLDSIQIAVKKVKLEQGDSLLLNVQNDGKMVRLELDQVLYHPTQTTVIVNVEGCGTVSQIISKNVINKFSQPNTVNIKTHCLSISNSYDPNDKQAFPTGFTNNHIVKPGSQMEYLVRFQNTGTDTAYTVYVIDSLDNHLDPESIELGAASHQFEVSMQTTREGRTFLRWQFDNINLPDSNVNELKSHGFFQYRISPKKSIPLGSEVTNMAFIYFDFNPPVLTNATLTTFDNVTYTDTSLNNHVQVVLPATVGQLNTIALTTITDTSAVSGGIISTDGGAPVIARGVCWSTSPSPTIALTTKTMNGSGTGVFISNLSGLLPSTTYYVRAYATNSVGTSYGEERQFTTLSPATVATVSWLTVTGITTTTATTSSKIISDGGAPVTVRGVVWNTSPNPTIALTTKTVDGSGTGTFVSNLSGLLPSTTYYVRAYATNSVGTSYGEERQFTTLSPAMVATVSWLTMTNITTTTATTSSKIISDGGAPVTVRGVVWNTSPDPTIALTTKTVDGADTGTFISNLAGLQPSTAYYVRAYATNSVGTSYGEERQFTTLFISVAGLEKQSVVAVFPNPFSQNLILKSESETLLTVIVCDVLAKQLLTQRFTGSATLSVSHLPAGVYHLKFPELNRVMKVVKE